MTAEKNREVENQQADVKESAEETDRRREKRSQRNHDRNADHARSAESEDCMTIDTACVGSGAG